MEKSNAKIEKQLFNKTDSNLIKTVVVAKKNPAWKTVASILTMPASKLKGVNLSEINNAEEKTVVVCGKVLSQGEINKKLKVAALKFSNSAKEKLINAGCEIVSIIDEIESNKDAKGVKILKWF